MEGLAASPVSPRRSPRPREDNALDVLSPLDSHCLLLRDVDVVHRRHNSYAHQHQMVLGVRVGHLKRKTSSGCLPHSPLSLSGTPQGPQTFMTRDSSFLDHLTMA